MKYPRLDEKQIKELKDIINDNSSSNREIKRAQAVLIKLARNNNRNRKKCV